MPNHTTTLIKIKANKTEALAKFVENHMKWEGSDNCYLDFETVVPVPKTPAECDPEFVMMDAEDAKSRCIAYKEEDPRKWFDWYHWQIRYWGTKWNSYNGVCPKLEEILKKNLTEIEIWLNTAWSPAIPVYAKLQEMYEDLCIDVYYSDEGGFYVGHLHNNGWDEYYSSNYGESGPKEICDILGQEYLYMGYDEDEEEGDVQ